MAQFTVQIAKTQYAYIDVEAEDIDDALNKADSYYDENYEEIYDEFETSTTEYNMRVLL